MTSFDVIFRFQRPQKREVFYHICAEIISQKMQFSENQGKTRIFSKAQIDRCDKLITLKIQITHKTVDLNFAAKNAKKFTKTD